MAVVLREEKYAYSWPVNRPAQVLIWEEWSFYHLEQYGLHQI